jgi:hypothetical protein
VTLASTVYAQPAIAGSSDVRAFSDTLLTCKVTKVLTVGITMSWHHDSAPPTGVKTTDTELKNSLLMVF